MTLGGAKQGQELGSMILEGPFQLSLFCDSEHADNFGGKLLKTVRTPLSFVVVFRSVIISC